MMKMQLKVTIVTFATVQLEKIPRLTAFCLSYRIPSFLGSPYPSAVFLSPFLILYFTKIKKIIEYIWHQMKYT